jgi:two-component system, OmpR family, sensor histidine kinase BaeS
MKSIWLRLALVFMAVSASGILISTILSIKEMDYHFSMYVHDVNEKHKQDLVNLLQEEYQRAQQWNEGTFLKLDSAARILGQPLTLYDREKQILRIFSDGDSETAKILADDTASVAPIQSNGEVIGYIGIHYQDKGTISLEEHFQMAHTNALQWTMLALLLIVCVVSILTAKRFTKPIVKMSEAATEVAKGNMTVRVAHPQGKDELFTLVETFNHLVHSLQQQDELRKRLTSDIAHELRTPLNTLLAQTEAMIDGIWEATPDHLEAARSEVMRLIRIVSDLDQVIQAESGSLSMSFQPVTLGEIVGKTVDAMRATFQQKGINLKCSVNSAALVWGDEQRLAQVFTNLLTNSCKHTQTGGEVLVGVWDKEKYVEVKVKDNGSGIPAQDLPHIFERFYRGDPSRNRGSGGTGLGLTIVKGIVEAHHGEVSVSSQVGKGTIITINIPIWKE